MRILHVITGLGRGGAETVLYRLVTGSTRAEHEVVCLEGPAWYSEKLEEQGIRVHHVDWSALGSVRAVFRLFRLIRSIDADLVQTWMYRSNVFGGLASRWAGKRVLWNIRCSNFDIYPLPTRVLAFLGGALARWIPEYVINCSAASQRLHARIGYERAPGLVIPNGYDPDNFSPDDSVRGKIREQLDVDPQEFVVSTVGRWHVQKGLPQLIEAMDLLARRDVPARLLMIGRDLERGNEELDKVVERTGCADRIHLMGERQDVEALSRASDVHVLASIGGEGFPNAVAETMLCATPNVVTNVGDAALIAGNTGWVVEPGDPQLLAAAIEDAYRERTGSPDRWAERRAASRERIVKEFPLKRMIAAYEEVWEKAARGHGDRRRSSIEVRSGEGKDDPRRLRVLHVINTLNVGGAETLLYRLVTTDPDNDHVVVSLGSPGSYSARLQEKGIRVHHLGMDSVKAAAKGAMRLNAIVRESNADVVQCWMYRSNVFGGVISKAAGKPVVWGVHNTSLEPLTRSARALVYLSGMLAPRAPDFIINCSARSSELHSKLGYQRARAAAVINNGYDAQSFHPDQERRSLTREALGIGAGEFVIGTVARWDPLKDIPNFLAAIRLVHERGIPFRCYAIGTGLRPRNVHFSEAVQSTGCSELVTPLGPRDDVPDLARALDLHVLASRTEAFPNVVAETMLSGTPNAVTDVGDVPTMVGSTGWVAPPCDPARLADAIVAAYHEWKDAPAQWAARRQAARQHIADNFSHERMMAAYQGVWREVAADVAA